MSKLPTLKVPAHLYVILACVAAFMAFLVFLNHKDYDSAVDEAHKVRDEMAQVHKEAQAAVDAARESERQNQSDLLKSLAAIAAAKSQPVTPVDYAKIDAMIAQRMGANAKPETHTDPQTGQAVTTVNAQALRDYQLDCDATGLKLKSCNTSVTNITKERDAAQQDAAASEKELQATKAALAKAEGKGFWRRLSNCGARAAVGGGVGAAAGQNKGQAAALGAAAGVLSCAIWKP